MMMNELPIRAMRGTRFLRAKVFAPVCAGLLAASIALPGAAQSANTTGTAAPPATYREIHRRLTGRELA